MYSGKKAQYDFPKMRGIKGRLELFQKFIRFGIAALPLVKDDLSKHALAFTWWAPHGPKLDDKKGEEDNDTVDNIGRRRVRFLNE